jgi:hypothetical protein
VSEPVLVGVLRSTAVRSESTDEVIVGAEKMTDMGSIGEAAGACRGDIVSNLYQ